MGDLTRRDKTPTPVRAVRKPPEQIVVDVPNGSPPATSQSAPQASPQQQPNVTQNIFYISAPAAPAAAAPQPAAKPAPSKPAAPVVQAPKKDTTVFNFDGDTNTPASAAAPSSPQAVVDQPPADLAAAKEKLEAARLAAAKRIGVDYTT